MILHRLVGWFIFICSVNLLRLCLRKSWKTNAVCPLLLAVAPHRKNGKVSRFCDNNNVNIVVITVSLSQPSITWAVGSQRYIHTSFQRVTLWWCHESCLPSAATLCLTILWGLYSRRRCCCKHKCEGRRIAQDANFHIMLLEVEKVVFSFLAWIQNTLKNGPWLVYPTTLPLPRLSNSQIHFTSAQCPAVSFKCGRLSAPATHTSASSVSTGRRVKGHRPVFFFFFSEPL